MATAELLKSWAVTERHLLDARAFLEPEVASLHSTSLEQFDEFLEHNELGLAFDWLESITRESQWSTLPLLNALERAASNMHRDDDARGLRDRIRELEPE
ncbi:hypothetical protein [Pseudoduganella violaceinigra]|uniref:hypothetical protein n=1 Tax=Pseudoduganella violaceinigra TaxID=246602 RepID=UPI0004808759|nr:hypothetical protein [Pseudoduganella violaceinigra]